MGFVCNECGLMAPCTDCEPDAARNPPPPGVPDAVRAVQRDPEYIKGALRQAIETVGPRDAYGWLLKLIDWLATTQPPAVVPTSCGPDCPHYDKTEASELALISARDELEECIAEAAYNLGCNDEWSSSHSHVDCLLERTAELAAQPPAVCADAAVVEAVREWREEWERLATPGGPPAVEGDTLGRTLRLCHRMHEALRTTTILPLAEAQRACYERATDDATLALDKYRAELKHEGKHRLADIVEECRDRIRAPANSDEQED